MENFLFKKRWIPDMLYKWYPRTTLFIGGINVYQQTTFARLIAALLILWSLYIFLKRC